MYQAGETRSDSGGKKNKGVILMHDQFISDKDIFDYMFQALIKYGYTPDADTLLDVVEMIFGFMVHAGIIEEVSE